MQRFLPSEQKPPGPVQQEIIFVLMRNVLLLSALLVISGYASAQTTAPVTLRLQHADQSPAANATLRIFRDTVLIHTIIADSLGNASLQLTPARNYRFVVSKSGYQSIDTVFSPSPGKHQVLITLVTISKLMDAVQVNAKKQPIEFTNGKTIINVEASVTNAGTNVLEVLEKSPGVIVDKNGGLILQGKPGVLVLIDNKPTYLSGAELNNMLAGMSASQIATIELMPNPPAAYDASGNAGIINIKTKRIRSKGFNSTISLSGTQGFYPKTNNSIILNYRNNKVNYFVNYGFNYNKNYTDIYALRQYFGPDKKVIATLDQPTTFISTSNNHNVRAGVDYTLNAKTIIGVQAGTSFYDRDGRGEAVATWLNPSGDKDSAVLTHSTSGAKNKNVVLNANLRHSFSKSQELAIDVDHLDYDLVARQMFQNEIPSSSAPVQSSRGQVPNHIRITTAKADYTWRKSNALSIISGVKSSAIRTDNETLYENLVAGSWQEDLGRSNHFIYDENIHALYTSAELKHNKFSLNGGLRYELTHYMANQLGNAAQKDSSFSRNYGGLFPSLFLNYELDSANTLSFSAGRRIDRPGFQVLNPFTLIINKYTYQTGNPLILPQYSTNLELGLRHKKWLTGTVSYSETKNYFSQIFLRDTVAGLLYYSQGNVGKAINIGLGSTVILQPATWWSFTVQAMFNHKELKGFKQDANFRSQVNQLSLNLNNQISFAKKYTAEISGFYISRSRNDLQELLYSRSQFSAGISRQVLNNKGSLKAGVRDIFHAHVMEGLTDFPNADEYFYLRRDTRVFTLAFTYRLGKAYKANKRSGGSATDEMERVGA